MAKGSRIASPCVGVCRLQNESCIGCGRSRDQIVRWSSMAADERDSVMRALGSRCGDCGRVLPVPEGGTPAQCPDCATHCPAPSVG
ncbi:DUF1289 domain-containing protein [Halomonadaceae bacterium KBTZ08]